MYHLVGGFSPTPLKKYEIVKWSIICPRDRGENSNNIWVATMQKYSQIIHYLKSEATNYGNLWHAIIFSPAETWSKHFEKDSCVYHISS